MNDKVSTLIINIKNASLVNKKETAISFSKLNWNILKVLKKAGYIEDFEKRGEGVKQNIIIKLAYDKNKKSKITDVKRISKLSKRIYRGYKDLKPIKFGNGISIITTPEGVITDKEARAKKVGGEVLFNIW